jgi:hypothetical protein
MVRGPGPNRRPNYRQRPAPAPIAGEGRHNALPEDGRFAVAGFAGQEYQGIAFGDPDEAADVFIASAKMIAGDQEGGRFSRRNASARLQRQRVQDGEDEQGTRWFALHDHRPTYWTPWSGASSMNC